MAEGRSYRLPFTFIPWPPVSRQRAGVYVRATNVVAMLEHEAILHPESATVLRNIGGALAAGAVAHEARHPAGSG